MACESRAKAPRVGDTEDYSNADAYRAGFADGARSLKQSLDNIKSMEYEIASLKKDASTQATIASAVLRGMLCPEEKSIGSFIANGEGYSRSFICPLSPRHDKHFESR